MRAILFGSLALVVAAGVALWAPSADAWGERGHDLITQVAVRLVAERQGDDARLSAPLVQRSGMLGHLSNVPDIVWRAQSPEVIEANAPTHYIGLDALVPKPSFFNLPRSVTQASALARAGGRKLHPDIGSAPWRAAQLFGLLKQALVRAAKVDAKDAAALEEPVNEVLLYAGLMAHFVGDLSQPDHTSGSHNGWHVGQGGVHAYFETELVNQLGLEAAARVQAYALEHRPMRELVTALPTTIQKDVGRKPLELCLLLGSDSFRHHDEMLALDRKFAVLEVSKVEGEQKIYARRKSPRDAVAAHQELLIARLATGADALATLWILAWEQAGKPDLSGYRSYVYPVSPEFVPVDYLPQGRAAKVSAP